MNPETQGKLMVAMLISILAFGLGTGTVLVTGLNNNQNTLNTMNTTKQSELPIIFNTNQIDNLNSSNNQNTAQNDETPTGGNSEQNNGQSTNNNPPSNNNTTN